MMFAASPSMADVHRPFSLETHVRLAGSTRNNTRYLATITPSADQVVRLTFRVDVPPSAMGPAELSLTPFDSDNAPPVTFTLMEPTADQPGIEGRPLEFQLQPEPKVRHVDLRLQGLRPRTTYTTTLTLLLGTRKHEWDVTLKLADLGSLAVDKAPPLQLVTLAPFGWTTARQFSITLRDLAGRGPFTRVRARVTEANQVKSNAVASNFTLDAFSFWKDPDGREQIHNLDSPDTTGLDVPRGGDLKIWARAEWLSPGEYNPVFRFTAANASEHADDSRLALNIQVRHHWWLAVVVILLGSAAGLFGNKYVAGYWTARALRRETAAAEQAAAALARPDPRGSPWWLRGSTHSYGLARARLILRQAGFLSQSVFRVIAVEPEIRERVVDARRRLDALEALEATRLRLQLASIDRAVVQQRIGAGIRRALAIVDGARLEQSQRAALDHLLTDVEAWLAPDKQETLYRDAVLARIRELLVTVTPADVPGEKVRARVARLLEQLEAALALNDLSAAKLVPYDHAAARLSLLWRDRLKGYADDLARSEGNGDALEALHGMANRELWERLRAAATAGQIQVRVPPEAIKAYDLVEIRLTLNARIQEVEVVNHPCVVRWHVRQADGTESDVLSYGLSLVQYFPSPGTMTFTASLAWDEERIDVPQPGTVDVKRNDDYRAWASFQSVELAVTGLAAIFAIVTGLGYGYNATFGTSSQYIGLFLWAAGASAGGNLFKQQGEGRTVGGQVAQLPTR